MISAAMISLDDLRIDIVRLGALTVNAITAGTEALVLADGTAAGRVVADDDAVDALRHGIEDGCLSLLGRPGLGPVDLRFVATTTRVTYELERSADLMVNIAKTTWRFAPCPLDAVARTIVQGMCRQVIVQLRVAVNAFVDLDVSGAAALADMDDTVDELHRTLLHHLLVEGVARGSQDADADVSTAVQLALVGHHYERIGDHAVNIANLVHVVVQGWRRPAPATRRTRELAAG
jgi:phosphate transport system protein